MGEISKLVIVLAAAAAVVVLAEMGADRLARDSVQVKRPPSLRAANVHVLPELGRALPDEPPSADKPIVLLMGNSHSYALPGLEKGKPLLLDPGVTLVDRLEAGVSAATGTKASYYRLAYPNFLPFEMLTRAGYLVTKGYDPRVVVFGLTYRNIARDSSPRARVQDAYRDPAFAPALEALLSSPEIAADVEVIEAIRLQQENAARLEREERMRSSADVWNEMLIDHLEEDVTLLGKSHGLRTLIYRSLTLDLQESFVSQKSDYLYDAVESDYAFNTKCLFAMLQMFRARGASVLIYLAPERADLAPLVNPVLQERLNRELAAFAAANGVHVVDARTVIPADLWGWVLDAPDRSHFSEKGHAILGELIVNEGQKLGAWSSLGTKHAEAAP